MSFDRIKSVLERGIQGLYDRISPSSAVAPASFDDVIWLLDTTAFPSSHDSTDREWTAEFVACFFHQTRLRADVGRAIAQVAQEIHLAPDDAVARHTIEARIKPFLSEILIGRALSVRIGDAQAGEVLKLDKSNRNGISSSQRKFHGVNEGSANSGQVIEGVAVTEPTDSRKIDMDMYCASASGWGVISDIDDTIKVSEVRDRIALLRNTFVNAPEPTPGFPAFYNTLHSRLDSPTCIYLSASPYNLYPFIRSFVRANYPHGQIILRDMSWMDISSFIVSLTVGTQDYKVDRMKKVHEWLPRKKWIAIGDSTQKDPESYAEIYKKYPGWIQRIWIRTVKGVNPDKEKELNSPKRFEKAFQGVPEEVWRTFDNVEELYAELDKISP